MQTPNPPAAVLSLIKICLLGCTLSGSQILYYDEVEFKHPDLKAQRMESPSFPVNEITPQPEPYEEVLTKSLDLDGFHR